MTDKAVINPKLDQYLIELGSALEMRDTAEADVVDVLRQVTSHTSDTGEDPYAAFGDPTQYAQEYAPKATTGAFWARIIISVIAGMAASGLLSYSVVSKIRAQTLFGGLSPWYGIAAGAIIFAGWLVYLISVRRPEQHQHTQRAGDARGDNQRPILPTNVFAARRRRPIAAGLAALVAGSALVTALTQSIATDGKVAFIYAGLCAALGLLLLLATLPKMGPGAATAFFFSAGCGIFVAVGTFAVMPLLAGILIAAGLLALVMASASLPLRRLHHQKLSAAGRFAA